MVAVCGGDVFSIYINNNNHVALGSTGSSKNKKLKPVHSFFFNFVREERRKAVYKQNNKTLSLFLVKQCVA